MTDLDNLIVRLREAKGPDRGLDGMIARDALGWLPYFDLEGDRILHWHECGGHWHLPGDVCDGNHSVSEKRNPDPPNFTSSIDAALTLVPEGWGWTIAFDAGRDGGKPRAELAEPIMTQFGPGVGIRAQVFNAATPAIALCIAALQALKAHTATHTATRGER